MADLKTTVLQKVLEVVAENIRETELLARNWMAAKVTSGFEDLEGSLKAQWEAFVSEQMGRQDAADRRLADHDRGLEDVYRQFKPVTWALTEGKAATDGLAGRLDAMERGAKSKEVEREERLKLLEAKFEARAQAQDVKIKALQEAEELQRGSLKTTKDEAAKLRRELDACRDQLDKVQSQCDELEALASASKDHVAKTKDDIIALQREVAAHRSQSDAKSALIEECKKQLEEQSTQLKEVHEAEIAGMKARLAGVESALKAARLPQTREEREKEEREERDREEKERKRRAELTSKPSRGPYIRWCPASTTSRKTASRSSSCPTNIRRAWLERRGIGRPSCAGIPTNFGLRWAALCWRRKIT
ncbi:hypothetical protein BV25DRAFT_1831450 [Artomyces pyxidatus]|uniref:Uncharacterized protein n=1 Tax=Artomyces pyxidatus TaxID=48021 RepID=A0ACB8SML4_9AGAM|nr:hypothetical protein BV25DRAFT_1831450 [Artomyces pyxidatus]